jgi:hypothetical protein
MMTRAEFARLMDVNRSQVSRWCDAGMPCDADGNIDPVVARRWLDRNIDPTTRIHCQARARRNGHAFNGASKKSRARSTPQQPPGVEHLVEATDAVLVAALPALACRVPRLAALCAAAAGASDEVAANVYRYATVGIMAEVAALLTTLGVPPPPAAGAWDQADIWSVDEFHRMDQP